MPIRDPIAAKAWQKRYQQEHRRRLYAQKRLRWAKQQEFIRAAKARPCADCGVQYDHWVMDFDHVRGEKRWNLAECKRRSVSWQSLKAEIAKCEIVCSNCHRDREWKRQRAQGAVGPPKPALVGSIPTAGATLLPFEKIS